MKKFNNKKSVLEQGGLMIEALAMLGMIAVVTPTMYKKSAERTMEVEDINTASAMRTYMNGVNSLLSANYIDIMEQMKDGEVRSLAPDAEDKLVIYDGDEAVDINTELKKYFPNGYDPENDMLNFDKPIFSVARSGNNLSAFVTFPTKGDEDDGIGKERTVRIASLIGSNGGYVNEEGHARGVGGTWQTDNGTVLGGAKVNSIVTSSMDVVNSSVGEGDNTKYLQRTAENGETWRNTMRTDIYMGDFIDEENNQGDYDEKGNQNLYSIRSLNQLIVGADGHPENEEQSVAEAKDRGDIYVNEKYTGEGARGFESYGLYIADEDEKRGEHGLNAYIAGSLEAAGRRLFADKDELTYQGPKIQIGGINPTVDANGVITSAATEYLISGTVKDTKISETETAKGNTLNLVKDKIMISDAEKDATSGKVITESDWQGTNVLLAKGGTKTATLANGTAHNLSPSDYKNDKGPDFPVVADSNMAVNGILAAGQLDTKHIRAAELSVGSEDIDDANKWMTVDKDGVRIHDTGSADGENHKVVANFDDDGIYLGADTAQKNGGLHNSHLTMDTDGITTLSGTDTTVEGGDVFMEMTGDTMKIGHNTDGNAYNVTYKKGGKILMEGSSLKVTNTSGNAILTVVGNDPMGEERITNGGDPETGVAKTKFNVHGGASFTVNPGVSIDDPMYLSMHKGGASNAAVNIMSSFDSENNDQKILNIDMTKNMSDAYTISSASRAYVGQTEGTDLGGGSHSTMGKQLDHGSIYVRKGLIDIAAKKPEDKVTEYNAANRTTADEASGTVRASRFVANNVVKDKDGNLVRVKYNSPINPDTLNQYQTGTRTTGATLNNLEYKRYDTYMVNPAYTSVMKDIKLTSRLGARLSDILPDFITKGIYLASNVNVEETFGKNADVTDFKYSGGKIVPKAGDSLGASADNYGTNPFASPYLGFVPAPQCPPGYGRAVTVAPYEFKMAQAGNLRDFSETSVHSSGFGIDEAKMLGMEDNGSGGLTTSPYANTELKDTPYDSLHIGGLQGLGSGDKNDIKALISANVSTSGGDAISQGTEVKISEIGVPDTGDAMLTTFVDEKGQDSGNGYLIYSTDNNKKGLPLNFQQSTWLRTDSLTAYNNRYTGGENGYDSLTDGEKKNEYLVGWVAMMGFIYPEDLYGDIAIRLGSTKGIKSLKWNSGTEIKGKPYYWNVFPVERGTLRAQVTTYCFMDNKSFEGNSSSGINPVGLATEDVNYSSYEDVGGAYGYDAYLNIPTNFNPATGSNSYRARQQLNDPALKYNELW